MDIKFIILFIKTILFSLRIRKIYFVKTYFIKNIPNLTNQYYSNLKLIIYFIMKC